MALQAWVVQDAHMRFIYIAEACMPFGAHTGQVSEEPVHGEEKSDIVPTFQRQHDRPENTAALQHIRMSLP